uniref:ubiquitin carboxyl-terminal hydrolase 19-like n=1 Tax=Styela clava TaxID=7725 RepID=UPI001939E311|nr:ubiquitin carboxyl-terminal hydrolase 19-like [Styela clava]
MKEYFAVNGSRNSLPGGARIAKKGTTNGWNSVSERPVEEESIDHLTCEDEQIPSCASNIMSPQGSGFQQNVGFTGLNNLGNTCFMNCVLQALANIRDLRDYFLSHNFLQDLNEENPLGTGGRLAKAFYTTLKNLWSGNDTYDPARLRNIVAKKAPQFLGIMQQDAQEFMSFFLDALHEDLNRVRNKPIFEVGDYDGYLDEEVARISWKLYKSRNDSFVIDKFHGLYKSRLLCPVCEKESITFDPFLFLSVPLPKPTKSVPVIFFPLLDDTKPLFIDIKISEEGGLASDVLNHIVKTYGINSQNLRVFLTESGKIVRTIPPSSLLPYLTSPESLIVCEISQSEEPSHEIILMQKKETPKMVDNCAKCGKCEDELGFKIKRCLKCKSVGYCGQDCQRSDWPQHKLKCNQIRFIGCPLFLNIQSSMANYHKICDIAYSNARHSVKILNDERMEGISKFDGLKRNLKESEKAAIACAYVGDSLPAYMKHESMFNLYICHDEKLTNMTLLENKAGEKIDLTDVTHFVIEWKIGVNVAEKPLHSGMKFGRHNNTTLQDCIQLFTEPEVLAREEAWYCPRCKKHREATKELSLWQLPDVLVIQLKRFSFRNRLWRDKIDKLVTFPVKGLDMSPFCIKQQTEPPVYDLFGVVNHHGGLFGGHYTSFVQLADENGGDTDLGWRLCDDTHVTTVRSEKEVVTSSSYVMFYHRRKKQSVLSGDCLSDDQFTQLNMPHHSNEIKCTEQCSEIKDRNVKVPRQSKIAKQPDEKNSPIKQKASQSTLSTDNKLTSNDEKSDRCPHEEKSIEMNVSAKVDTTKQEAPLPYTDMDAMD